MAFDPGAQVHNIEGFGKAHPYATAGIILVVVFLVWYVVLRRPAQPVAAAQGSSSDASTAAAGQIIAAQTSANEQTALAQISAGVQNNQTAAAQAVSLATIQGQTDAAVAASAAHAADAYYGAETAITNSNSAVAIEALKSQTTEQVAQTGLLASEFGKLADVLKSFGGNVQSITNSGNAGQVALGESANSLAATESTNYLSAFADYIRAATTPVTTSKSNGGVAMAGGQLLGAVNFNSSQTSLPTGLVAPSAPGGGGAGGGAGGSGNAAVQTQTMWGLQTLQSYFSSALAGLSGLFNGSRASSAPVTAGGAIASQAITANTNLAGTLVPPPSPSVAPAHP